MTKESETSIFLSIILTHIFKWHSYKTYIREFLFKKGNWIKKIKKFEFFFIVSINIFGNTFCNYILLCVLLISLCKSNFLNNNCACKANLLTTMAKYFVMLKMVICICTQQGHWGLGFKVVKQNIIDQLTCSASNHQFVYELCSTHPLKYKGKYFNKTVLKWNQHKSQGTVIKLYVIWIFL